MKLGEKQNIKLPKYVSVDFFDEYMQIKKRWRGVATIFMTLFSVVWLVGAALLIIDMLAEAVDTMNIMISLFLALVTWVALYSTLANWLNATNVFVSKNVIEIKISPISWPGNKRIEMENVKQLYVKKVVTGTTEKRQITYELRLIEQNGEDTLLLKGAAIEEYLLFLEQEIEKYLGIKDTKI